VDWASGKIQVTGIGIPPADSQNLTVKREMTQRAALADGQRKLIKAINEIKVAPDKSLRTYMADRNFKQKIEGFVKGYRVTAERLLEDGRMEIDLELPLTGPDGLSRYLAE
jgi:hypothetical protein